MELIEHENATHEQCATRYPILLVHGVSVRDSKRPRIWGRIPQALESLGARVYVGGQDGWATFDNNAVYLRERISAILAESGVEKLNVVAHSKGGIDVRRLVAMYMTEGYTAESLPIASISTVASPHHGSKTLEFFYSRFRPIFKLIGFFINTIFRIAGDEQPDFYAVCNDLGFTNMQAFNRRFPTLEPIFNQQFACRLRALGDGLTSLFTYPIVSRIDGPNDGLVALNSTTLDNFCGEILTAAGRGISHAGVVDIARRPFRAKPIAGRRGRRRRNEAQQSQANGELRAQAQHQAQTQAQKPLLPVDDILDFYISLASDLKARGY